jgi:hypothetical protein
LLLPTYFDVLKRIVSFRDFSAATEGMMSRGKRGIMFMYDIVTREKLLTSKPDVLKSYPEYHRHLNKEKTRILNDIGSGYQKVIPPLFLFSLAVFSFFVIQGIRKKKMRLFTVASGAALTGILSIGFILTLLTITSYSEIERAMHSAYPMVLLFIMATALDVVTRLIPDRKFEGQDLVSEA